MLKFFNLIKYLVLLFIAGIFLYFSFSPNELENYVNKYSLNKPLKFIQDKYNEYTFIPLSDEELSFINSKEIFINYPQKSIRFSINEIGISFDKNRNQIVDQTKFENFINTLSKDLSYLSKGPVINLETSEFYSLGENSKIEISKQGILNQLEFNKLLSKESTRVIPEFDEIFNKSENIIANQSLQNRILKSNLQLKAGRREINLTTKEIELFFSYKEEKGKQVISLDPLKIEKYLVDLDQKINFPADVDYKLSSVKLASHLLFRLTEENPSRTFILPITGSYSISPQRHSKFIEVNKSQQRAYLFQNGELFKTYIISTGVTWETPTGQFKVLNKVPMTISYTNNWYMPWYLPIGTINGPYYFGFHEVPYHMDYKGMIYSRDPETIGSPATGGCIQVLKGQAKEIYDWAEVGIPVYITD